MVVIPRGHKDRKPRILHLVAEDARILFGNRLRELRKQAGLSQEALAYESGLDRSYVGGVERGEYNISLKNICLLADALGVPPFELLKFSSNGQKRRTRPSGR
jgi:transcriptional regulator with XRE-family HTH domain